MLRLAHFLCYARQSNRLIQSLALAFVLSLGVAVAAPAVQAAHLSPDQQIICTGTGGMKVITFAADGSAQETSAAHGLDCLLCGVLHAIAPASPIPQGSQTIHFEQPVWTSPSYRSIFESRAPPARAPPLAS
jgi:Protein of unknown function (DUF2946)